MIGRPGIPGSAKSTFVRSAQRVARAAGKKLAVALTWPSEADGYDKDDARIEFKASELVSELFWDDKFLPDLDLWEATGYGKLLRWVYAMRDNKEVGVVAIDTMNGADELIVHETTKMGRVRTLKEVGEYGLGFQKHDAAFQQLLQAAQVVTLSGKHFIGTWHVKMKEREGAGDAKEIKAGQQVDYKFEDRLLPVLATPLRQQVDGVFSLWLHSDMDTTGQLTTYKVLAEPREAVPGKSRYVLNPKLGGRCDNDFKTVLDAIGWTA